MVSEGNKIKVLNFKVSNNQCNTVYGIPARLEQSFLLTLMMLLLRAKTKMATLFSLSSSEGVVFAFYMFSF